MNSPRHWYQCRHLALAAATVAGVTVIAGERCFVTSLGCRYRPLEYSELSRATVQETLSQQASRGMVYNQTLWNTHFEAATSTNPNGDDEVGQALHYSGRMLLERLVRQFPAQSQELFLQTAHDVPFDSTRPEEYVRNRDALDRARAQAARDYLVIVLRQPEPSITVINPHPLGMGSTEAASIFGAIGTTGRATLLPNEIAGNDTSDQ